MNPDLPIGDQPVPPDSFEFENLAKITHLMAVVYGPEQTIIALQSMIETVKVTYSDNVVSLEPLNDNHD